MQDWIRQFRKGLLELCIMNHLRKRESYGYEIVRRLRDIEALSITESTLYPILARLGKEGHLKVRSVPSPSGPPRRYFSLTPHGEHYLDSLNRYWATLRDATDDLIAGRTDGGE